LRPPSSTPFPYTTLFRTERAELHEAQTLVHRRLELLDMRLEAVLVVDLVQDLAVLVRRHRSHADLERRHVERAAHGFGGPVELLDELRVHCRHAERLELEPIAEHCNTAAVPAAVRLLPPLLQRARALLADDAGRGQDAARIRLPRKEVVAVLLNVQPEVGREAGREDRRDADQR